MSDKLALAIIQKLKGLSIPNVILFSDVDIFPETPYVIIKPEVGVVRGTRTYRIVAHMNRGQYDELRDYIFIELDKLLETIYDDDGSRYKLYHSGYTDITPSGTDDSYFMERMFSVPMAMDR